MRLVVSALLMLTSVASAAPSPCLKGKVTDIRPLLNEYVSAFQAQKSLDARGMLSSSYDENVGLMEFCELAISDSVFNIENGKTDAYYAAKRSAYLTHLKHIDALSTLHPEAIAQLGAKLQNRWDHFAALDLYHRGVSFSAAQWISYSLVMAFGGISQAKIVLGGPIGEGLVRKSLLANLATQVGLRSVSTRANAGLLSRTQIDPPFTRLKLAPPTMSAGSTYGTELLQERSLQAYTLGGGVASFTGLAASKWFSAPVGASKLKRYGGGLSIMVATLAVDIASSALFENLLTARNRSDLERAVKYQLQKINLRKSDGTPLGTIAQNLWRAKALVDLSFLSEIETRLELMKLAEQLRPSMNDADRNHLLSKISSEIERVEAPSAEAISFTALDLMIAHSVPLLGKATSLQKASQALAPKALDDAYLNRSMNTLLSKIASRANSGKLTFHDSTQLQLEIYASLRQHPQASVRVFAERVFKDRISRSVVLHHFAKGGSF